MHMDEEQVQRSVRKSVLNYRKINWGENNSGEIKLLEKSEEDGTVRKVCSLSGNEERIIQCLGMGFSTLIWTQTCFTKYERESFRI